MQNVQMLIIDPQRDFMDEQDSALPVGGATADMQRTAKFVERVGAKFADVHVTFDSHNAVGIERPGMWVNDNGDYAPANTIITAADVEAGIWRARNGQLKPGALGGKTIQEYLLAYVKALESQGNYPLMIWPTHCVIGTPGWAMQADLAGALSEWEIRYFATLDRVTKGSCPWTEHYGALSAEVPLDNDASTGFGSPTSIALLNALQSADMIAVAGEAASHCVMSTVNQIADRFGDALLGKFYLLTDAMSPVVVPGGPDFTDATNAWLKKMESRGMHLTTTTQFLA